MFLCILHFTLLLHPLSLLCFAQFESSEVYFFFQILKELMVTIEMCYKLNRITKKFLLGNQNLLITATKLRVMITLSAVKDSKEIINERWFEP